MQKSVLLIDADSTIPNIPIMKLSTFYKERGCHVDFIKGNIPYFPSRIKKAIHVPTGYDLVCCSVVFRGNVPFVKGSNIVFGGTGFDLHRRLPAVIERCSPDYSLYPACTTSYGFITRGCIRKCWFCVVRKKEGNIHQVATVDSIIKHKRVKFLDNNILAFPGHKGILKELVTKNIRCQFNQGLDIRLVTQENSKLLQHLNYIGEYIFAFDNIKDKARIQKKLALLSWRKDWQFKFFVYVHPKMPIEDVMARVHWLTKNKCLPYIMRDVTCWKAEHSKFYTDLASYCNQVPLFKKMSFQEYLTRRHGGWTVRAAQSLRLYNTNVPHP